jgi:hypothetical protein
MRRMSLTRRQWEQVSVWLALNQQVNEVEIVESKTTGIGLDHTAKFFSQRTSYCVLSEMDITDTINRKSIWNVGDSVNSTAHTKASIVWESSNDTRATNSGTRRTIPTANQGT